MGSNPKGAVSGLTKGMLNLSSCLSAALVIVLLVAVIGEGHSSQPRNGDNNIDEQRQAFNFQSWNGQNDHGEQRGTFDFGHHHVGSSKGYPRAGSHNHHGHSSLEPTNFATDPQAQTSPPPPPPAVTVANNLAYIVLLKGQPVVGAFGSVYNRTSKLSPTPKDSQAASTYAQTLVNNQDRFLSSALRAGSYTKLWSFTHVLNGFAVHLTSQSQVAALKKIPGFLRIERDTGLKKTTTYTPKFLGLDAGAWNISGGASNAGEDVIIGVIDTGVTPTHPAMFDNTSKPYGPVPSTFLGHCNTSTQYFPVGSCNKKLIGAAYFAQSALSIGFLDPDYDFLSPLDGDGHGTHTSAIAGGNKDLPIIIDDYYGSINFGNATGIAPRARISAYKCVYRDGGLLSDCVAAIDQAVQDNVHVITMSLGPAAPPSGFTFLSSFDIAMLFAVKAGITVVQSAGNYGSSPGTITSFSPWIFTVGATSTDRTYPVNFNLGNGQTVVGNGLSASLTNVTTFISSADAIVNVSAPSPTDCQDPTVFNQSLIIGKILICFYSDNFDYGFSSVVMVVETARELNATAFLLLAANATLFFPIYYSPIPLVLPGAFINDFATSQTVVNYYTSKTVYNSQNVFVSSTATATITTPSVNDAQFGSLAPVIADYSSRGPTVQNSDTGEVGDVLKPDIVAPGSQIWSAWSNIGTDSQGFAGQDYALISGTSMSTPHVAGVVAMLKQKFPTWSPAAIRSAIVTTASLKGNNGQNIQAQFPANNPSNPLGDATPFDMGGGFINPTTAFNPGLIFDCGFQDYVNFLCAVPGIAASDIQAATGANCSSVGANAKASDLNTPSITIVKLQGTRNVTRILTSVATINETYTVTSMVPSGATMTISPLTFTISPGQAKSVLITITATSTAMTFNFGRITWTGSNGHVVNIPVTVYPYSLS